MKNILIAGGSGYLGKKFKPFFEERGYNVRILTRRKNLGLSFQWKPQSEFIDPEALKWAEILINLSGENIGQGRWTPKRKRQLVDSRVFPTRFLVEKLNLGQFPNVRLLINASAIGYYPVGHNPLGEDSEPGKSFQSEVVEKWEKELEELKVDIRMVVPRISFVVAADSEGIKKMALPVKMGVGSPLGNGNQIMPWIHLKDLLNAFHFLIRNEQVRGPVNLSHPKNISNRDFMRALARRYRRPFFFPNVPSFVLKLILGEMSILALDSIAVSSQKIQELGFNFQFPDLDSALAESN